MTNGIQATASCFSGSTELAAEPKSDAEHQHGYMTDLDCYLQRIDGRTRGIDRMIDDEKYCIDILTQVSALPRALQ